MPTLPLKPWYREPWPWILMAGPAAVVVAGAVTTVLAVRSFDGLVAEDYYKQGLAVNQVLARAERAVALGIEGRIVIAEVAGGAVRVDLRSAGGGPAAAVRLSLSHPTRAGMDQHLPLVMAPDGSYVGRLAPLAPGRWHVILEDATAAWRIRGELRVPTERSAELHPGR